MGNCIKRQRTPVRSIRQAESLQERSDEPFILVLNNRNQSDISGHGTSFPFHRRGHQFEDPRQLKWVYHKLTDSDIDKYVLETLRILRVSAENDKELILRMKMFMIWANGEAGWKMVLQSLIRAIPLDDPLGPSAITLFIDHCPLPTKKAVFNFVEELKLSKEAAHEETIFLAESKSVMRHRNICAVLGHLVESLAAPFSNLILTEGVLEYHLNMIEADKCSTDIGATNVLFSLIAFEKMSQIKDNKLKIMSTNITEKLIVLEKFYPSENLKKRQVGFLAQWLLDNVFVKEGRRYTYETINLEKVNVMLNDNDVSEYLKISPDGLEARSDAPSFESVRCTYSVDTGVWFYEATIITSGVMQLGWATKNSKFLNHDGFGIGDDEFSCAYDGCRQLFWYRAQSRKHPHPAWKEGDVLGLLLDIDNREVIFYLNGSALPPDRSLFTLARSGFFAAASFMSFQQCHFNFGSETFKFPPTDREFSTFNEEGYLGEKDKMIIPRHQKFQAIQRTSIGEDSCSICFDIPADTELKPCGHGGICHNCAEQIAFCHLCREAIISKKTLNSPSTSPSPSDKKHVREVKCQ